MSGVLRWLAKRFSGPSVLYEPKRQDTPSKNALDETTQNPYLRVLQLLANKFDKNKHCKQALQHIPHYEGKTEHWFAPLMATFFASDNMFSMILFKSRYWKRANPASNDPKEKGLDLFYNSLRTIITSFIAGVSGAEVEQAYHNIDPQSLARLVRTLGARGTSSNPTLSPLDYIKTFCALAQIRLAFMLDVAGLDNEQMFVNPMRPPSGRMLPIEEIIRQNKMLLEEGGVDVIFVTNLEAFHASQNMSDRVVHEQILQVIQSLRAGYPEYRAYDTPNFLNYAIGAQIHDQQYIKDGVFFTDLDEMGAPHTSFEDDIVGLTCGDQKYIYNFWMAHLPRGEIERGKVDAKPRPDSCIMVPYDWVSSPNVSFQLDKFWCDIENVIRRGFNSNMVDVDKSGGYRMFVCVNAKYARHPISIAQAVLEVPSAPAIVDKVELNLRGSKPLSSTSEEEGQLRPAPLISAEQPSPSPDTTEQPVDQSPAVSVELDHKPPPAPVDTEAVRAQIHDPRVLQCMRRVANFSKLESYYKFTQANFRPDLFLQDLPKTSPKLDALLRHIEELDTQDMKTHGHTFKHFIYSDLTHGFGSLVIASGLLAKGRHLIFGKGRDWYLRDADKLNDFTNKRGFGVLTKGSLFTKNPMTQGLRRQILDAYNARPDNVHGQNVQILVVDRDFKEGIDLYDVRYVHIFEPQIYPAYTDQVIGRATRMCGQKGLQFEPFWSREKHHPDGSVTTTNASGWPLYVWVYQTRLPEDLAAVMNAPTLFDAYMNNLGLNLKELNFKAALEAVAIESAVDYALNYPLHAASFPDATRTPEQIATEYVTQLGSGRGNFFEDLFLPFLALEDTQAHDDLKLLMFQWRGWNKAEAPRTMLRRLTDQDNHFRKLVENFQKNPNEFIAQHRTRLLTMLQDHYGFLEDVQKNDYRALLKRVQEQQEGGAPPFFRRRRGKRGGKKRRERLSVAESVPSEMNDSAASLTGEEGIEKEEIERDYDDKEGEGDYEETEEEEIEEPKTPSAPEAPPSQEEQTIPPIDTREHQMSEPKTWPEFNNYVETRFANDPRYAYPRDMDMRQNLCEGKATELRQRYAPEFTPTQNFVSEYFNPRALPDLKGMLLWHSVGTGKTCTAIATATRHFVEQGYTILWVTRSSLRADIEKNLYETICDQQLRSKFADNYERVATEGVAEVRKHWFPYTISHSQFTNMVSGYNKSLLNYLMYMSWRGSQVNANDEYRPARERDFLYKTLIVVDEAHRLYNPGADSHVAERADMEAFQKAVQHSYKTSGPDSARLLMLTATPITNDPLDMIRLLNLTRPESEGLFPTTFDAFETSFLDPTNGFFTPSGRRKFMDMAAGRISYLNRTGDPRQFAQPVINYIYTDLSESGIYERETRLFELTSAYKRTQEQIAESERLIRDSRERMKVLEATLGKNVEYMTMRENVWRVEQELSILRNRLKQIQRDMNALKKTRFDKNDRSQEAVLLGTCFNKVLASGGTTTMPDVDAQTHDMSSPLDVATR